MPKATLEYDLSDPDDVEALQVSMEGRKYQGILWDVDQALRNELKYHSLSEEVADKLQAYRDKIYELLQEAGVTSWP